MLHIRRISSLYATLAVAAIAGAASPAAAQIDADKLSIHGYLTQGYAVSSEHPIVGVPTVATADYRAAALQVRYALTDRDAFVLQLNHRRASSNPLVNAGDEVQLGWAFYQHRIGNGSIRVGRTPATLGLYNETRFVGTLIPLYRAPVSVYDESFEALDGVLVSQSFEIAPRWRLDASAYGGGFDLDQLSREVVQLAPGQSMVVTDVMTVRNDRLYGGQLWLETPIQGVRVGGSAARFKPNDITIPTGMVIDFPWVSMWQASLDATTTRGSLRTEYRDVDFGPYSRFSYYAQGVGNLTEQLAVVAQAEFMAVDDAATPNVEERSQHHRDLALGARFALSPSVVFKLEGHRAKGYLLWDEYTDLTQPRKTTTYGIASVSVSF
ncbi:MAG TPA: hypothetical protein VGE02_13400 [Gemmatimonadales bacterium]